jgi:hypothetical protein
MLIMSKAGYHERSCDARINALGDGGDVACGANCVFLECSVLMGARGECIGAESIVTGSAFFAFEAGSPDGFDTDSLTTTIRCWPKKSTYTLRLVTPGPSLTIFPTPSWPPTGHTIDMAGAQSSFCKCKSVWHTPVASILMRTSPSCGSSTEISLTTALASLPGFSTTAAFWVLGILIAIVVEGMITSRRFYC